MSNIYSILPSEPQLKHSYLFTKDHKSAKDFVQEVQMASVKHIFIRLRRLSLAGREQVSAELQRLEHQGIIERVDASEWFSPVVIAHKPNRDIQLCVYMRDPNKACDGQISSSAR